MGQPVAKLREVSDAESAAYEAAREILTQLVGIASNRTRMESEQPDSSGTKAWNARRETWVERLHKLKPWDTEAVQAVLNEDGQVLRTLRKR